MVKTATAVVLDGKTATKRRVKAKASAGAIVKHAGTGKSAAPAGQATTVAASQPSGAPHGGGRKQKLVRDSFTMPAGDFALIHALKERALTFRRPTKKSELLRAGLHALMALNDARLRSVLDGLAPVKSGRPRKTG
jgi:hypothetical protein